MLDRIKLFQWDPPDFVSLFYDGPITIAIVDEVDIYAWSQQEQHWTAVAVDFFDCSFPPDCADFREITSLEFVISTGRALQDTIDQKYMGLDDGNN